MGPFLEIDRRIATLAGEQDGVVRRAQLQELGLTAKAIRHRVARGSLLPLYRGVYAVGHKRLSPMGRRLAAVWACGERAALSHRSAAIAWGLRGGGLSRVEVTVRARSVTARDGLRIHLTTHALETTNLGLLPITTPARTLLDLAGVVPDHQLAAALRQAEVLDQFDLAALRDVLDAHPRHPGRRPLTTALATTLPETLSDLEDRFLALCAHHGLPRPAVNARPLGFRVDFLWPDRHLVAETDGWRYHRTRAAFETDRARDQALAAAGFVVLRFTHRQIASDPTDVSAKLSALLGN
ncbi:type IV toxin-antitoxin system AbiEi family antitoxin domain-containing protein [Baekduia sp. Peel2402]|uniref:type IV toxin-antitoxin system AbiEi family antitoxin domain-containing protein n=1 Tax=Baekduia sp. Peel2402 TaxID=3458296 RepID=UPI00403EE0A0